MTMRKDPPFRAEHIGSLLRPQALLDQRIKWMKGELPLSELRKHEDKHIADAVKLQEDVGLQAITDGEYRRESFHYDFISKVEGVEAKWDWEGALKTAENAKEHTGAAPFVPKVPGKMSLPKGGIEVENFKYVKSLTKRTPKVTIPSPTMMHFRGGRDAISKTAYPKMEEFFADLARVYREELKMLGEAGCTYVQMDDTNLAYLCDTNFRQGAKDRGDDPDALPRMYAELINESIKDRPANMKVGVHLCRGNARSMFFASGGYEPVAEAMLGLTKVDAFFLEYDDARSGDFAPLRFTPKGEMQIVLGLITTKKPQLEKKDDIKRRIDEASKYVRMEQLCLSPQCGFSSNALGNLVSVDDEKKKLGLVIETANEVWK
jgi:5-methyltetrahydropteroyltriglutamate--homocysteine methyltransferase